MSWSMGSIDCIAVKIDNDYIETLKKDVEEYQTNPKMIEDMSKENQKHFEHLLDTLEANDLEDIQVFCDNYIDYIDRYGRDNYAQEGKINFETGKIEGDLDNFEGYVVEISWGSESIYGPEFKSKESLKETIESFFYMPKSFDWKNKIIFLTGVWQG